MSTLYAHMFKDLVTRLGGVDAAAAAVEAATGAPVSRGTVSRTQNGLAAVPLSWAYALEDATGNYCFTRLRVRTMETKNSKEPPEVCQMRLLREATEAICALSEAREHPSPEAYAALLKEAAELADLAGAAVRQAQAKLDRLGLEADE